MTGVIFTTLLRIGVGNDGVQLRHIDTFGGG